MGREAGAACNDVASILQENMYRRRINRKATDSGKYIAGEYIAGEYI